MTEVTNVELELEGKVFIVEKDKEGNVVSRDELNGELVLKSLLVVLEDAIRTWTPSEVPEKPVEEKATP